MLYSKMFGKTNKSAKEFDSLNATLLHKAGYIDQVMAGVYTFMPLGLRVLTKIENIIRKEMDKVGNELLMPSIAPVKLWEQTGRLNTVDVLMQVEGANALSKEKNDAIYILNCTHEDVVTPLAQKYNLSYKDFPFMVYQIQTKFRNEARPKSGLLRGREFRMKDLYSFHTSQESLMEFYEKIKTNYVTVYKNLGLGDSTFVTFASGGDFTKEYSHEFQTILESGEDTIYLDRANKIAYNKEVTTPEDAKKLGVDFSKLEEVKASEVGNIFPLGTKYTKAIDYMYVDENDKKHPIWMGSYGIGSSRLMGVIAEKFNDEKGLKWPESVAPFAVHLIGLNLDVVEVKARAVEVYEQLLSAGVEVLFDDRIDVSAGEKFSDCDLIGIPLRVVVSKKNMDLVEVKNRCSEKSEVKKVEELISALK